MMIGSIVKKQLKYTFTRIVIVNDKVQGGKPVPELLCFSSVRNNRAKQTIWFSAPIFPAFCKFMVNTC